MPAIPVLFTIGYEGATLPEVLAKLRAASVAQLLDIRAVAASRKPGFAKSNLAASLRAEGIGYHHLRALGTPPDGRAAARAGRIADLKRIYLAALDEPAAQAGLIEAAELAAAAPSALLCFCATAAKCHRHLVAPRLGAERIVDL